MKAVVLSALIAGTLAGVIGFGLGRSASGRRPSRAVVPEPASHVLAPRSLPPSRSDDESEKEPEGSRAREPASDASRHLGGDALDRFFKILMPLYADDAYALRKAMFGVTLQDKEAQASAFDLIMSLEDPAMLEESGVFLTYAKDPDLVARMVDAFESDSNPHRRAALATALGQGVTFPAAQPVVESILAGRDATLQAATLKWLTLESLSKEPELAGRLAQTLRTLVLSGETISVRSAAVTALKGDPTEAGARFLIDRILDDPSPEVQKGAIWSLSLGLTSIKPPIPGEQADTLWRVFRDESRDGDVRYQAARLILTCASWNRLSLSQEDRQSLDAWISAREKARPR